MCPDALFSRRNLGHWPERCPYHYDVHFSPRQLNPLQAVRGRSPHSVHPKYATLSQLAVFGTDRCYFRMRNRLSETRYANPLLYRRRRQESNTRGHSRGNDVDASVPYLTLHYGLRSWTEGCRNSGTTGPQRFSAWISRYARTIIKPGDE